MTSDLFTSAHDVYADRAEVDNIRSDSPLPTQDVHVVMTTAELKNSRIVSSNLSCLSFLRFEAFFESGDEHSKLN